jgi:hypothetical protein
MSESDYNGTLKSSTLCLVLFVLNICGFIGIGMLFIKNNRVPKIKEYDVK